MVTIKNKLISVFSYRETGIITACLSIFVILSIIEPSFFTISNLLNVSRQIAILGIMATGLGVVMISGNIDLSIGSTYGLAAVTAAKVMLITKNFIFAIISGLLAGLLIGSINGFLVEKIKVPSFIATFGMLYTARGIALITTNGYPITLFLEGVA